MDLSAATFTRATTATYVDIDGTTQTDGAAIDEVRDGHYQTIDGVWTRTLRLEAAETEVLYVPWVHAPQQDFTVYVKFVERGTISAGTSQRYWGIGGDAGSSSSAWVLYAASTTNIALGHNTTTNSWQTSATVQTNHSTGNVIEACGQFDYSNSEQSIYATVNGGAILSTTGQTLSGVASVWESDVFALNAYGTGNLDRGTADFIKVVVAAGVQSMEHMRSL
jgi:hypothetical protein